MELLFGKILKYPKMDIMHFRINTVYVMFIHFTIKNIFQLKIIKNSNENIVLLFLCRFKMRTKMCFMSLEIWKFDCGKVLEIF